jgi:hypothetical protein
LEREFRVASSCMGCAPGFLGRSPIKARRHEVPIRLL